MKCIPLCVYDKHLHTIAEICECSQPLSRVRSIIYFRVALVIDTKAFSRPDVRCSPKLAVGNVSAPVTIVASYGLYSVACTTAAIVLTVTADWNFTVVFWKPTLYLIQYVFPNKSCSNITLLCVKACGWSARSPVPGSPHATVLV